MTREQLVELIEALDSLRCTAASLLNSPSIEDDETAATFDLEDLEGRAIAELLADWRQLILEHPDQAVTVVRWLSNLGRRHAETPDGAELLTRLTESEHVEGLRSVWSTITMNTLEDLSDPQAPVAARVELLFDQLAVAQLDQAVTQLKPEGFA